MVRATFSTVASSLVAASLLALALPASAAKTVYRCNQGGKIIYADEPCGGNSREVDVDDSRSLDQRKDAQAAAKREADLAKQMRRDRIEDEREAARRGRAAGVRSASSSGGVEYSNVGGKIVKTVKPKKSANGKTDDETLPIYIDVPKRP